MAKVNKVELGLTAGGVLLAITELIHGYPYLVGLKDPENYQLLFVQVAIGTLGESLQPSSSVENNQIPIKTVVPVTPEGTPLFTGVLPPGTAVVPETGEVITVTPPPIPVLSTPRPDVASQDQILTERAEDRATPEPSSTPIPPTATQEPTAVPPTAVLSTPLPPAPTATEDLAPPNLPTPEGLPWPKDWSPPPDWPPDTVYRGGNSFRLYRYIPVNSSENPMPWELPDWTRVEDCRTDRYCPLVSGGIDKGNGLTVSQSIELARQIAGDNNVRIRVIYIGGSNSPDSNYVSAITVQILNK